MVGVNGAGKTTVGLTSFIAGLKGIAERSTGLIGERFRFIGSSMQTADVEWTLRDEIKKVDIKVKNHIAKQGNKITFEAPPEYPISQEWLDEIFNVAFVSAKHFCAIDSKKQAELLGIDTTKFDNKIAELKSDYTLINREIAGYGALEDVKKVEPISVSELMGELQTAQALEFEIQGLEVSKKAIQKEIDDQQDAIIALQEDIEHEKRLLADAKRHRADVEKKKLQILFRPILKSFKNKLQMPKRSTKNSMNTVNILSRKKL